MKKNYPKISLVSALFFSLLLSSFSFSQNLVYSHLSGPGGLWKVKSLSPYKDSCIGTCKYDNVGDIMGIGGDIAGQYIYGFRHNYTEYTFFKYRPNDSIEVLVKKYPNNYFYSADFDNNNGIFYTVGLVANVTSGTQTLYQVNTCNGNLTPVCNLPFHGSSNDIVWAEDSTVAGLAYDHSTNMLYAACNPNTAFSGTSVLYRINPATCASLKVGNMNKDIQGLTWDNSSNKLYGVTNNNLYEISTVNASLVNKGNLGSGWGMGLSYAPWALGPCKPASLGTGGGSTAGVNASGNPAACGGCNGSASASPSGCNSPFSFIWNNGETAQTISGLCAGSYTVILTDNGGSTAKTSVAISAGGSMTNSVSTNTISCGSGCSGTASASPSGGNAPYSFVWSNGKTGSTVNNLCAGNYTVTVSDNGGCSSQSVFSLDQPGGFTVTETSVPATCTGSADAYAAISVSGGTTPYLYNWSNGATNAGINNVSASVYSYTVQDANNCSSSGSFNITVAVNFTASASGSATIQTGSSIAITASSGNSYLWNPATGLSCSTCQSPQVSPATTTNYCVQVTDVNGCSDSACVTITVETPCGEIFLPTAFSPNGDGQNETECVMGAGGCVQIFNLNIYDRWGNKVFESTDELKCWDGKLKNKLMDTGIFIYSLSVVTTKGETIEKHGNITLLQ